MSEKNTNTEKQPDNFETLNELQSRLAQASAMLMVCQGEDFDSWDDEIKHNYAWACSEMVSEARELAGLLRYR